MRDNKNYSSEIKEKLDLKLDDRQKLSGTKNFRYWFKIIEQTAKNAGMYDFLNKDMIKELKNLKENKEKIIEAEKIDGELKLMIIRNVHEYVFNEIEYSETAFDMIRRLKNSYYDQQADTAFWIKELNSLKSNNKFELTKTLDKMFDIFNNMKKTNVKISNKEKIKYIYNTLPPKYRDIVNIDEKTSAEEYYNNLKSKIGMKAYLEDWHNNNNTINNNLTNEKTAINHVGKLNNKIKDNYYKEYNINKFNKNKSFKTNKNKNNHQKKLYCHICKKYNHNTDRCRFNLLTSKKYNKKHNKNQSHISNKPSNINSISKINNSDNNENLDDNINYDDIRPLTENMIGCLYYTSDNEKPVKILNQNIHITTNQNNTTQSKYNINHIDKNTNQINNQLKNKSIIYWLYDSGAAEHITNNINILSNFKQESINLNCANGTLCKIIGYGECCLRINNHHIKLSKVLYAPMIKMNILSSIKLIQNNIKTVTELINDRVTLKIINRNKIIGAFTENNNNQIFITSELCFHKETEDINSVQKVNEESKLIWHRRLGHFYHQNIEKYLDLHNIKEPICVDCKIVKMKRRPHNKNVEKSTRKLEVIHSDIIGPLNESINGHKFILTFIDEATRKSWLFSMKSKADAIDLILNTLKGLNNLFDNYKIKYFKSDQGREYQNKKLIKFCKENGIIKIYSPPYNPENNGLVERFNQTVISCAKTLLFWSKLSQNFWDYAVIYANYLYNHAPHSGINYKIPNEIFFNKKVNINHIRTFGCITNYYIENNNNKNKMYPNSKKGILLGYKETSNSYIVMDFDDYKIHQVSTIACFEDTPANISLSNIHNKHDIHNNFFDYYFIKPNITQNSNLLNENNNNNIELNYINKNLIYMKNNNSKVSYDKPNHNNLLNFNYYTPNNFNNKLKLKLNNNNIGNKKFNLHINNKYNNQKLKINLKNCDNHEPRDLPNKHLIECETIDNKRIKINNFNSNKLYIASININIPNNYYDALNSRDHIHWEKAIIEELNNFYLNDIMEFVKTVPKGKTIISTKWIFSIKKDSNNKIYKFKARLVARGFRQKYGIDFELTYSPTLNIDGLKFIIALAAKFKWNIFQLDIKAAYLNAPLDKEIYTTIPPGDPNHNKGFWRLKKALYGLKQSGRQWNQTITIFLQSMGFIQLSTEKCIFKKILNNKLLCIIGLYVDDMIITGERGEVFNIIEKIKIRFKISKCGEIDNILGIKVELNKNFTYSISQENFIINLLDKYNIGNIKKSKTPCTGNNIISENKTPFDKTIYKSAVGSLIFLARGTRPDISFAVNKVARKCEEPNVSDWKMIINIFKYLNSTKLYKITYDGTGHISAYSDSDFAGDSYDRKSTSGYIILMGKSAICWSSKKQTIVATSTTEAEYISTSECIKKVLWIRNIIMELLDIDKEITIYTDNLSSKSNMENGDLNTKLKHIDIKYHFNRDNIDKHRIKLEYIETNKMIADILTKDVNGNKMTIFTNYIFN